ncbi:MAG: hypothetical protein HYU51_04340 [Candidatus Rokubacteria bacterium]|nr:hypothetical protein [Candidatus Rokubacteria bacterium]
MNRREQTSRKIDEEIRREKAAALGRAGERLEAALAEVRAIAARLDTAVDGGERERLLDVYEGARLRVRDARFALLIQRGDRAEAPRGRRSALPRAASTPPVPPPVTLPPR